MKVFERQLQLAGEANLPVIIHTREAEAETIEILKSHAAARNPPGIMHCFSGSSWLSAAGDCLGLLPFFFRYRHIQESGRAKDNR